MKCVIATRKRTDTVPNRPTGLDFKLVVRSVFAPKCNCLFLKLVQIPCQYGYIHTVHLVGSRAGLLEIHP